VLWARETGSCCDGPLSSSSTMDALSVKVPSTMFSPITPPLSPQLKTRGPATLQATKMEEIVARSDVDIPDNYVEHTIRTVKPLPPLSWSNFHTELNWLNVAIICVMPVLGLLAACYTPLLWKTFFFSIFYYFVTGMGITAGYHRLWAHRSYNASLPLQYILAIAGAGAVEGSIKWWCRGHRAHHRYTDTDLDPYDAHKGFFYSHVGWIMLKPRRRPGVADVSDLSQSAVVQWQHKYFIPLILIVSFAIPTLIPWYFWGDAKGGYVYAGVLRLCFVHHVSFFLF